MWSRAVFSLALASLVAVTHQQYQGSGQVDFTKIPDHLVECYSNETLYERDRRIPATINSLIAIVQKLENGAAMNMDMRTLTTTILRQYRVDGIQREPRSASIGVVPFVPTGQQNYRMTFLFNQLLPSVGNPFPNGTLTPEEKCALHFMLSDSIDPWDRGDTCGQVSTFNSRRPRSIEVPTDNSHADSHTDTSQHDDVESEETKAETAVKPIIVPVLVAEKKTESASDTSMEADGTSKPEEGSAEEEGKQVAQVEAHKMPILSSSPETNLRSGKLVVPGSPLNEKMLRDYPMSDCPVENGVIYTTAGSVSAGIMLSGIAAGLQPQSVSVKKLLESAKRSGSRTMASSSASSWGISIGDDNLSNLWFATLAGDLAEAAIYQGPLNSDIKIGVPGGWNDTTTPHWYFLNSKENLEFTDAEIRGGLDGLIMGKKISAWNSAYDQRLRLSQVLDMYYSQRGISDGNQRYRACQRKDFVGEVAPMEEMKSQSLKAAKVLINVQPYVTIMDTALQSFTEMASQRLSSFIPSGLVDVSCKPEPQSGGLKDPSVELVIVMDTAWNYPDIKTLIGYLADKIKLGEYGDGSGAAGGGGSKLTLLSGKDATAPPLVNGSTSFLDLYSNFTLDIYNKLTPGLDMVKILTRLRSMYAWSMQNDRQRKISTGRPQAVLFLPSLSFTIGDSERSQILSLVNRINTKAPDTTLLFMAPMAKDTFFDFVADKDKDIFQISTTPDYQNAVDPLVNRLADLPRRIINPACTYRWESDGSSGSSVQYADPAYSALFFRLHPNYFFKSDKTTIRFQGRGDGQLNVCYSRKAILTGSSTNSSSSSSSSTSIKCKSVNSDNAEFSEDQPCSGASLIKSCDPMYFSVAVTSSNKRCTDSTCRNADMVRFTVTHTGLTCASGVEGLLTSRLSITMWIILLSSREVVNRIFFSG